MNLISIPALTDNYIWLLHNDNLECIVVDPGEASPVLKVLEVCKFKLLSILLTHHHHDHVGGVRELLQHCPVPVYGPQETASSGSSIIILTEGDIITLLDHKVSVFALPGHTIGHIGFYSAPWLFCGDTVFSAGCGRLFDGTPKQMYHSLQKINKLSSDTLICGAHEYTLANLNFATTMLPNNSTITNYLLKIKKLRNIKQPSLPTTLHLERQINLFFRCHDMELQHKLHLNHGEEEQLVFAALRKHKNIFDQRH